MFLWFLRFLRKPTGARSDDPKAHRQPDRQGPQDPSSHAPRAVTLSNEHALSRFRPCLHPAPAASASHEPPMAPQGSSIHTLVWSICGVQRRGRSGLVWRGRGRARRWARPMASVGIRKRVSARTGRVTYQVWWLLDDGSQGAETVSSKDEARDLVAKKRLGVTRGAWQGLQRGQLPFSWWAEQWWEVWAADPDRSPTTLAVTESRLRLYVRPWFGERPIKRIGPGDIRRWQAHLASSTGHATLMQCRSLVLRILQFAVDEGAIDTNPVRKVPSPRRRADPCH